MNRLAQNSSISPICGERKEVKIVAPQTAALPKNVAWIGSHAPIVLNPTFWILCAVAVSFALGFTVDHHIKARTIGTPNHIVSGGSMYPTFDSGDELIIRDLKDGEALKRGWIVKFTINGDPNNVKRVMALPGQEWQGKFVPEGYVALWGDCKYTTEPDLPLIPLNDVTGQVVGVRYAKQWESPEGKKTVDQKVVVKVMPAQDPLSIDGINISRVDRNSGSLTEIGISGDVRKFYHKNSVLLEESTSSVYHVKDVGFDPTIAPYGLTRILTREQFGSWTNGGRVVLLADKKAPPKDVAALFVKLIY